MPKRIAVSTLNASTMDILNVIRNNASLEYQNLVPAVQKANDIPKVGEVLYGYPALANQFISALMNRIAAVRVKSALFNNPYRELKKGFIEFGESIEEIFVNIANVRTFNYDKAEQRELKRSLPDVRSAFHAVNFSVQYPTTVTETDLRKAFLSMDGVQDLIARVVDAVYKAAEYDEWLLFKYMIIKAVTTGKMYPVSFDAANMKNAAVSFRGMSNKITFMSNKYNAAGVKTVTPKDNQVIFMSAEYNAKYDVEVLAAAFNMDKADFMGRLYLIDDFTTFDNERWSIIREESDIVEEVTSDELNLMKDVQAVLVDSDWFQFYDNIAKFTEKFVAAGDYWNYFYRVEKTISFSPFANALVFVAETADTEAPETLTAHVTEKSTKGNTTVLTIEIDETDSIRNQNVIFIQTQQAVNDGIGVHKYGSILYPNKTVTYTPTVTVGEETYVASAAVAHTANIGDEITLNKQ